MEHATHYAKYRDHYMRHNGEVSLAEQMVGGRDAYRALTTSGKDAARVAARHVIAETPPHLSPALTGRVKSGTPKFESKKWAVANVKLAREYEQADADHEKSTTGYVYIITNDVAFPGMVKIGETGTTPQSRAANAATWCPLGTFKVIDARLVDDRHDFEDRMHRMLDGFHVRGEWFKCSVELATNMLHAPTDEAGEAA